MALDDARRATGELKLAVPGTDWVAIEQRTSGLVRAPLLMRKRNRAILGAIAVLIALFAAATTLWVASLNPQPRPDRYAPMRRELAEIARQRRVKIVELQRAIGAGCAPGVARELARQLVMDGRTAEVRAFAAGYTERCGDDAVLVRWASAPAP